MLIQGFRAKWCAFSFSMLSHCLYLNQFNNRVDACCNVNPFVSLLTIFNIFAIHGHKFALAHPGQRQFAYKFILPTAATKFVTGTGGQGCNTDSGHHPGPVVRGRTSRSSCGHLEHNFEHTMEIWLCFPLPV